MHYTDSEKRTIFFTILVAQFAIPYMFSGVGITLPIMGKEFSASGVALGLVEAVYIGAAAAFLLPFGRLADMHGHEPVYRLGFLIYTVTTIALGFAPNISVFIGIRFVQGFSAALIVATNLAILTKMYPPQERGRVIGLAVAAVYVGLSAAPYLAGIVTLHLGWRWVYFTGAPMLIIGAFFTCKNLKGKFARSEDTFDWQGSLYIIAGIELTLLGGTHLHTGLWGILTLLAGLVSLFLFIRTENRAKHPVLDLALFHSNKVFSRAASVQLLNYAGSFGVIFLFTLYLQVVRGLSPQTTGQILIIQPVVQALLATYFGKLADKHPPHLFSTIGVIFCTAGTAMGAMITQETSYAFMYAMFVVLGIGFAAFASPNMVILMGSVPPAQYGIASAISGCMRSMGMVVSMAIITIAISWFMGTTPIAPETIPEYMTTMRYSLIVLVALGVWCVFLCLKPAQLKHVSQSE